MPLSGIDLSTIDASVRPQDDLYQHVNGGWLKSTVIPDDRPLEGTFTALRDASELAVKEIIEQAAARGAEATGIERKIGDLYNSFMDEAAVEAKGLDPLRARLAQVFATTSVPELVALAGRLFRADVSGLFYIYPAPDAGNPDRVLLYTGQGGLGLPDESYYREAKFAPMVQAYRAHVGAMLGLAEVADPEGAAGRVVALETALASHHWDNVTCRTPQKTYNLKSAAEAAELFPLLAGLVRRGRHRAGEARRAGGEPARLLLRRGLCAGFRTAGGLAGMARHARAQRGRPVPVRGVRGRKLRVLWHHPERYAADQGPLEARRRGGRGRLGEAVGQIYVAEHFPAEHKARMQTLVANLIEAYRESITRLAWMGDATKPRRWRSWHFPRQDRLPGQVDRLLRGGDRRRRSARQRASARTASTSTATSTRSASPSTATNGCMTPQTVNAYYNPLLNEIVFPAAILQPPFFDCRRRRRRQLRRHRRRDRPRNQPRLRRPGLAVRRQRPAAQLVDGGRPRPRSRP